jgi:hypothetical protein
MIDDNVFLSAVLVFLALISEAGGLLYNSVCVDKNQMEFD